MFQTVNYILSVMLSCIRRPPRPETRARPRSSPSQDLTPCNSLDMDSVHNGILYDVSSVTYDVAIRIEDCDPLRPPCNSLDMDSVHNGILYDVGSVTSDVAIWIEAPCKLRRPREWLQTLVTSVMEYAKGNKNIQIMMRYYRTYNRIASIGIWIACILYTFLAAIGVIWWSKFGPPWLVLTYELTMVLGMACEALYMDRATILVSVIVTFQFIALCVCSGFSWMSYTSLTLSVLASLWNDIYPYAFPTSDRRTAWGPSIP